MRRSNKPGSIPHEGDKIAEGIYVVEEIIRCNLMPIHSYVPLGLQFIDPGHVLGYKRLDMEGQLIEFSEDDLPLAELNICSTPYVAPKGIEKVLY